MDFLQLRSAGSGGSALEAVLRGRIEDLGVAYGVLYRAVADGQAPELSGVAPRVLYTAVATLLLAQLGLVLLVPRGRKFVIQAVDTVLAVVLIVLLLAFIISLPFGAVYIGVRGTRLMARSLIRTFPQARALAALAAKQLGWQALAGV